MLSPELLARLDLRGAVERELSSKNRLLPRRVDHRALHARAAEVERWLKPMLRRRATPSPAGVVLADKSWRGTRPLTVMALEDRVLYRALVDLVAASLPDHLRQRQPAKDFREAPLGVDGVTHISKTDVAAYYQYVDHELLADELIAQTGEEPAVLALCDLLQGVMGRRVGIPQVHTSSDILGDAYLDPVRRHLTRQGYAVFRYADDFRLASPSLGTARSALEACANAVRERGLVLNETKTLTYGADKYRRSLASFPEAEARLFADAEHDEAELSLLGDSYADDDAELDATADSMTLGSTPVQAGLDEDGATPHEEEVELDADPVVGRRAHAAGRAWELWLEEQALTEPASGQTAAITQSLLERALPALGSAGDDRPLGQVAALLRKEPALTPQVAAYLIRYAARGDVRARAVATAIDEVVGLRIVSPWQGMWLAHVAGTLPAGVTEAEHLDWLRASVTGGADGLAATAAAALGRRRAGDPAALAAALDRVGPEWRTLVLYGLGLLDPHTAEAGVDSELDRLVVAATAR